VYIIANQRVNLSEKEAIERSRIRKKRIGKAAQYY
jgi:hypothetical protein